MATGGLYGSTSTGTVAPQSGSESVGLYGNNTVFGGSYFEYLIFLDSVTTPATPTGGSWSFVTNTGTPPTGWTNNPPQVPTGKVWISIALVNSKSTSTLTWSTPGIFANPAGTGTVTSVAALTLTTAGTDVSSTVSNPTIAPVITLNLPTASATNRGALSAADWTTFNNKGSGTVTSVTGTAPVVSSGGTTPAISMAAATASVSGYLTSTDWTTFNSKGSGSVTSVAATVPSFLSVTGSPITTSGTLAISYSGTALPVANGGTGVTASSGANSVVLRDASVNISVNSISEGYSNVAAAGTTTTLTIASVPNYVVTGSGGQTYQLPDATTLPNGVNYTFNNNQSSGTIVVKNNSGTTIATIQSGGLVDVSLLSNSIAAGSWDVHNLAPANVSWSTNTLDYPGSITSTTWNGVAVAINRGGTGQSTAAAGFNALSPITNTGDLIIGNGTNSATRLAIGTNGYVLTSNGTTASWSASTGGVTSVTGTSPVVSSGGSTPAISLAASYGDTQNPYASKTANYVLAAPNGTAGVPTFRAIVAADIPTLNQNTTGTAANITATSNSTLTTLSGLSLPYSQLSGVVPTWNQNTTGTASNVTGTVAIANGGTGATTAAAALTNLGAYPASNPSGYGTGSVTSVAATVPAFLSIAGSPITTSGTLAISYSGTALPIANGGSGATTAQAAMNAFAGAVTSGSYLRGNGTNVVMSTIQAADVPTLNQNTTGSAASATTATTATNIAGGTNLQIPYNTGSGATSFITAPTIGSTYLQYNGTGFTWASAAGLGTVTSVAATVPSFLSISGSPITTAGTLAISYSGTALPIANGGTGATTAQAAINSLVGTITNRYFLRGNGTNAVMAMIQAADIPTLNQDTTGTAANVTGTIAIANGGTALTTTPTNGQLLIGNGTGYSLSTLTAGSNITITNASGAITIASTGGGGGSGLSWQSVQTANFTAVSGNAYPVNTTSSAITVTLPASPTAGNFLCLTDYAGTFATNSLILNPNGSKIDGTTGNSYVQKSRESIHLVYIDSTQGWIPYSGFNTETPVQSYSIDYLVVSGGGGGGGCGTGTGIAAGGGAGGYLSNTTTVSISTAYTVTIGAGGNGGASGGNIGANGSTSSFNSVAPVGGGGGSPGRDLNVNGASGGSGGGGGGGGGGSGQNPGSATSGQGNAGGTGATSSGYGSGGGGGAGAVGGNGSTTNGGTGGAGLNWQSLGTYYAGGGGGSTYYAGGTPGTGGTGGGGNGSNTGAGGAATVNTGGGGGGSGKDNTGGAGGAGGSGIVIIRYVGSQRGSGGTVTSVGGYTYHTFTSSSTFTA